MNDARRGCGPDGKPPDRKPGGTLPDARAEPVELPRISNRVNIYDFLQIPAMMFPDQNILVHDHTRLTYGGLMARVNRLAAALAEQGLAEGERVAVLATNSHRYVEAYLAIAALGAVFVPLNYRAKRDELRYMVESAKVTTLFHGERYREAAEALKNSGAGPGRLIALDGGSEMAGCHENLIASGNGDEFTPRAVDEDQTAILMYTSGTTSRPKGVNLTHGDFTLYVTNTVEMNDGAPRGAMLMVMPIYHIAGATNILTSLFSGRKLVLLDQFDAENWLRAVPRESITHSFLVPTMLAQVLDHPAFNSTVLSSLENLAYGGAPMPVPIIRTAIQCFPSSTGFVNAFGQTETTSTLCVLGPEDHRLEGTKEERAAKLRRLGSVARPLPDVEIRISGENGEALPSGEVGEIWVRTARMMKGYEGMGDPTARGEGWHATGDMGCFDEAGYLFIAGRKDDMIIRGGENISPAEVEGVLYGHPAVEEVAVLGVPDTEWGQRVGAAIVLKPGHTVDAAELREYVHERLSSFKQPEHIRVLSELPKTATGKVLKRELQPLFPGEGDR